MFHYRLSYWRRRWGRCWLVEFPAGKNAKGLLVVAQQSWHKSRRNASHVQTVRQNACNSPIWQSYYLTKIVDSLPMIGKDNLANFCCVFRCCACRQLSRTFVRPWSDCTIKKFCLGSRHYLRRLPVAFGGFLRKFFRIETKFYADSLLLKISRISCKKNLLDH